MDQGIRVALNAQMKFIRQCQTAVFCRQKAAVLLE